MTRRQALSLPFLALAGQKARAQQNRGMASRSVKAIPRAKPSGLPFHARFTNVARAAGLHAPVIYGGASHADFILESMGCGAAFLDYDNDGWLDIVLLTGRRFDATPEGAVIRLYRNNRDGTFADVTEKSGLGRSVWAAGITVGDYDNDGFDDLFITCWGQNLLFHNNGDGTFTDVTEKAGLLHAGSRYRHRLHLDRLRPRRPPGPVRFALRGLRPGEGLRRAARTRAAVTSAFRSSAGRPDCPRSPAACTTTTATARSPTSARSRASRR